MAGSIVEDKARAKAEQWRERIAEQESSGLPVKQFCNERGLSSWSFYKWRKELRETGPGPVRFALVERRTQNQDGSDVAHGAGSVARMIHLPASVRVYLCLTACDMRKSFDGLHALVRDHLELDAFAGHLFVFASRRRDRVKILYWDRDGFAVWSKRLEEGTYAMPLADDADGAPAGDHGTGIGRAAERNRPAARPRGASAISGPHKTFLS